MKFDDWVGYNIKVERSKTTFLGRIKNWIINWIDTIINYFENL